MKNRFRCRMAVTPEDKQLVEEISYRVWSVERPDMRREDIPLTIRAGSITFILEVNDEPTGTIRVERRTPDAPLRIEELLAEAGMHAEHAQVTRLIEDLSKEGAVGGISAWEVIPASGTPDMQLGGYLVASAIKFCQARGIYNVLAFMEVNTRQNRFAPHMAKATHVMRFWYPVWNDTYDLWLIDLRTVNAIGQEWIDNAAERALEI